MHKFLERRAEIVNFEQGDAESLYDAWERFKLCLKRCPKHGIDSHAQMQHFTQGLRAQTRMLLDASAGGSLKNKDEREAMELIESMAQNEYRANNDRGGKKKPGMLELEANSALLAESKLMNTKMETLLQHFTNASSAQHQSRAQVNQVQDQRCDFCRGEHENGACMPEGSEEAKYLANFRKSNPNYNPNSNTYNPGWRDHPNFGWRDTQNTNPNQPQTSQPSNNQQATQARKPLPLEDTLCQFMKMTQGNFEAMKVSQDQLKLSQEISNKNQEASIKNLETQIGQLSREFAASHQQGFEGHTTDNP
jgi:hypothetical protein